MTSVHARKESARTLIGNCASGDSGQSMITALSVHHQGSVQYGDVIRPRTRENVPELGRACIMKIPAMEARAYIEPTMNAGRRRDGLL